MTGILHTLDIMAQGEPVVGVPAQNFVESFVLVQGRVTENLPK